jgi:hypothetical protein
MLPLDYNDVMTAGYMVVNDDVVVNYEGYDVKKNFNEKMWGTYIMLNRPELLKQVDHKQWPWWDTYLPIAKAAIADMHNNYPNLVEPESFLGKSHISACTQVRGQ